MADMLGTLGSLVFRILANDETEIPTKSAIDNIEKLSEAEQKALAEKKKTEMARKQLMVAGAAAITSVGVAGVALINSVRPLETTLNTTAMQIGMTSEEMKKLALETANASFSLDDVSKTFDLLARQGVSKDEIGSIANAFDTMADAINSDASIIAENMLPILNTFAIETASAEDHIDALTYVVRNSSLSIEELSSAASKLAPEINASGMSIQQFEATMLALNKAGYSTQASTSAIKKALSESTKAYEDSLIAEQKALEAEIEAMELGTESAKKKAEKLRENANAAKIYAESLGNGKFEIESFNSALGLVDGNLKIFTEQLSNSTGTAEKFAESNSKQYGLLANLKNKYDELAFTIGTAIKDYEGLFGAMSMVVPAITSLNAASDLFSTIQTAKIFPSITKNIGALGTWMSVQLTQAGVTLSTVIPTLTAHAAAAWAAAAPYLAIILPVAAVIAVLIILEKKFGLITKTIELVSKGFEILVKWFKETIPKAIDATKKGLDLFIKFIGTVINPIGTIVTAFGGWTKIFDIVKGVFDRVINFIKGIIPVFKEAGKNIILNLVNGIMTMINKPYELMFEALRKVRNLLPFSPAKEGPLSKPVSWESYLVDPLEKLNPKLKTSLSAGLDINANTGSISGGSTINIGTVNLDTKYNFEAFMKDVEAWQRKNTLQRGIRSI